MKLATVKVRSEEQAVIVLDDRAIPIRVINEMEDKAWSTNLFQILQYGQLAEIQSWYQEEREGKLPDLPYIPAEDIHYAPLYRSPGKILGVGMNYMEKAIELSGKPPQAEPVIFMKPNTSLIGPDEAIQLPAQSDQVTAEAELGIIIGKACKDVAEQDAYRAVAGFTTTMDMTAKDIHARDPRYLQRSKSFDTFFSFGPQFITIDEFPQLEELAVETVLNGEVRHRNVIANMMYQPGWLVSFFSQIMMLHPGDVIMTGTPGSILIREGDVTACHINGFQPLQHPVADA